LILVVNLNLTVDRIMEVDILVPGVVHRATRTDLQAGGKGVNVIRTLKTLGLSCRLLGIVAGRTGDYIDSRLEQEGIDRILVTAKGDSRTSVILLETNPAHPGNSQTVINENGPVIDETSVEETISLFAQCVIQCDLVVLTGSVPPGFHSDIYKRLIELANQARKQTILDAAGEPLRLGISAGPTIVKPNQYEAGILCDCSISSGEQGLSVAQKMLGMGVEIAATTLGKDGMVVARKNEAYRITPPIIEAKNAVGSGDAAAAGFAAGCLRGLSLADTAKLAVACGTASARHGFGRSSRKEIEEIRKQVIVGKL